MEKYRIMTTIITKLYTHDVFDILKHFHFRPSRWMSTWNVSERLSKLGKSESACKLLSHWDRSQRVTWESCQNENCNENSVAAACLAHQNILHSYPAVVLQTKHLPEKGGVSMFMQFMIFLWFPHTPNKEKGRRLPFFGPFPLREGIK